MTEAETADMAVDAQRCSRLGHRIGQCAPSVVEAGNAGTLTVVDNRSGNLTGIRSVLVAS